MVESTAQDTLLAQLSGYGATPSHLARTLSALATSLPLETWDPGTLHLLVSNFVDVKFPTVLALNKIDHPDADANISRITRLHPPQNIVLSSSIAEVFLRKLKKQGFIRYLEGSDVVETREDLVEDGDPEGGGLKEADERLKTRIENLRDMVLYRFGGTGVGNALARAAELLGVVPVFPVKNAHVLPPRTGGAMSSVGTSEGAASATNGAAKGDESAVASSMQTSTSSADDMATSTPIGPPVFRDCVLMLRGATVRDVARKIIGDAPLAYCEGPGGVRVGEDDLVEVSGRDVSPSLSVSLQKRFHHASLFTYLVRYIQASGAQEYPTLFTLFHNRDVITSPVSFAHRLLGWVYHDITLELIFVLHNVADPLIQSRQVTKSLHSRGNAKENGLASRECHTKDSPLPQSSHPQLSALHAESPISCSQDSAKSLPTKFLRQHRTSSALYPRCKHSSFGSFQAALFET